MASANISPQGSVSILDGRPEPDRVLTEKDAKDAPTFIRLLTSILRDVASLKRVWRASRIDFEGLILDATGTVTTRLEHRFGGPVRYWIADWDGAAAPNVRKHALTDQHTLVITSTSAGKATIRVEQAG